MYGTHFKPPQCKVLSTTQLTIENIHIDKYLHPQQTCQATLPTEWASRITMTNMTVATTTTTTLLHTTTSHTPLWRKSNSISKSTLDCWGWPYFLLWRAFLCALQFSFFFWHTHQIRYHMGIMSQLNQSKAVVCNERANKKVMIIQWHPIHHNRNFTLMRDVRNLTTSKKLLSTFKVQGEGISIEYSTH